MFWFAVTLAGSVALGWGMARFTDAAAPHFDAIVAASSVTAQILQSMRRIESWALWIVADLIAVPLFLWKGLLPTATLYMIFLAMAVAGLVAWNGKLGRRAQPA